MGYTLIPQIQQHSAAGGRYFAKMAHKTRTASNMNPGRLGGDFHWPYTALCFFYPSLSSLCPFLSPFSLFFRLSRTTETLKKTELRAIYTQGDLRAITIGQIKPPSFFLLLFPLSSLFFLPFLSFPGFPGLRPANPGLVNFSTETLTSEGFDSVHSGL